MSRLTPLFEYVNDVAIYREHLHKAPCAPECLLDAPPRICAFAMAPNGVHIKSFGIMLMRRDSHMNNSKRYIYLQSGPRFFIQLWFVASKQKLQMNKLNERTVPNSTFFGSERLCTFIPWEISLTNSSQPTASISHVLIHKHTQRHPFAYVIVGF